MSMKTDTVSFMPEEGEDAAGAFRRYDLISAAVVDSNGLLMGRLTVEDIVDIMHEESDTSIRRMGVKPRGCIRPCRASG